MFNKAVFKQTVKANRVMWLIITAVLTLILVLVITQYDPSSLQAMIDMAQSAGAFEGGSELVSVGLLGILATAFFSMIAIILMLVYNIITANGLVAGEVDRGSMAYTLSTPIKRSSVIVTKATYLVTSILAMILIFIVAGLVSVQAKHQLVYGVSYTQDIKEISKQSDYTKADLENHLWYIQNDDELLTIGAKKRNPSWRDEYSESYIKIYNGYLTQRLQEKALEASANVLGISVTKLQEDYSVLLANNEALQAGADASNQSILEYQYKINALNMSSSLPEEQQNEQKDHITKAFEAGAKEIEQSLSQAYSNIHVIISSESAMNAATKTYLLESGLTEEQISTEIMETTKVFMEELFISIAAGQHLSRDKSVTFSTKDFLLLNLGLFLLMFALSGISFIASSIFNLSKYSFALGAGLPLLFYIFQMVANIDQSLSWFKYLSLNTLFDTTKILNGQSVLIEFIVLGVVGIVLYLLSFTIFKKKDLPL